MADPLELDMSFVASKKDGSRFIEQDSESLTVSLVLWAESVGLLIGGGFQPINDNGLTATDRRDAARYDALISVRGHIRHFKDGPNALLVQRRKAHQRGELVPTFETEEK